MPGAAQIYKHILAGPLWQRRNGTDFAFFQSHTGFARGENGGVYEDMLCIDFAPALHFVNVRAQRYKCPARPGLCGSCVENASTSSFLGSTQIGR